MAADEDGLLAVVAHGLLGSVAACSGALGTVLAHPDLGEAHRRELLLLAQEQTQHMAGVLQDLMRGTSPETLAALDTLGRVDGDE